MPTHEPPRATNTAQRSLPSEELHDEKPLDKDSPSPSQVTFESDVLKVLFVCTMNKWRSRTAEDVYRAKPFLEVRSCGTSRKARRTFGSRDLKWANVVMVMEAKHKARLLADFPGETLHLPIHVLDVPDLYRHMDPELVHMLELVIDPLLETYEV